MVVKVFKIGQTPCGFLERVPQRRSALLITNGVCEGHTSVLTTSQVMSTLIRWALVVLAGVFHCEVTVFSFSILFLGR